MPEEESPALAPPLLTRGLARGCVNGANRFTLTVPLTSIGTSYHPTHFPYVDTVPALHAARRSAPAQYIQPAFGHAPASPRLKVRGFGSAWGRENICRRTVALGSAPLRLQISSIGENDNPIVALARAIATSCPSIRVRRHLPVLGGCASHWNAPFGWNKAHRFLMPPSLRAAGGAAAGTSVRLAAHADYHLKQDGLKSHLLFNKLIESNYLIKLRARFSMARPSLRLQ